MTPRKRRLVAYLRVSTIEQAEHGFGLDSQRKAIRDAAKALDGRVVSWCADEGKSGALDATERPGLTEALTLLRTGAADGLIVRDLDRLARAVTVQEALLAEVWCNDGAAVFTASPPTEVARDDPDDPMRTAMREMAGVFAGLERRLIAKRLRDGRRAKAAAGGHAIGATPYGWRSGKRSVDNPNGALVPVPEEQAALERMKVLAEQGNSTRQIAAALTGEGYPTKRGGSWSGATVARILARHQSAESVAVQGSSDGEV
ncbi:recombinase family protein [Mycolicibacterium iranicum]|uniref:Recombinase family protein n=1 Tax=Mycolicibacterium iranicum TaxID=912594 RepID=A0ABT4HQB9_MYCIR|nr:recombinase family protein [Mycolicibacterium iranicum]MCZ0731867.1 recombinase family protein [Mycolicibacterium iranicum]